MKAVIVKSEKQTLPQFNAATGKDEPTLVVVTHVHFLKDDGTLFHAQTYAQRPEEIDADNPVAYFDKQAAVLQGDLEGSAANAGSQASSELADKIVEKLNPASAGTSATVEETEPAPETPAAPAPAPDPVIVEPTENENHED